MLNNSDGAAVAQYMAVGEELSRAMVEVEHLRAENERLREVLRIIAENKNYTSDLLARAALGEKE